MRSGEQTEPNAHSIGNRHESLARRVCAWLARDTALGCSTVGKVKKVAVCVIGVLLLIGILLWIFGVIDDVYRWLVRYMQPPVWAATAAWLTLFVATGAFLYAREQVGIAKQARIDQEKHSSDALEQQAKLARESLEQQASNLREQIAEQARIAQKSLDEQARQAQVARDEMAQPNVVIYAEPLESDWQIQEIIIKNFGNTPAYAISVILDLPFQSLPNNLSNGENYDIPIPVEIPTLVPGQSWKTMWDSAEERLEKRRELRQYVIAQYTGGPPTGTDIDAEVETHMPRSRHNATVQYADSKGKIHQTRSFLDFNMLDGSIRPRTYGIHDIAKKYVKG